MTKLGFTFYPLGNAEIISLAHLTKSQLLTLLYLRTLDPYSHGMKIRSSWIAKALGISKRSVNDAIIALSNQGLIEIEDSEFQIKISPLGVQVAQENAQLAQDRARNFPPSEEFPTERGISQPSEEFPDRARNFPLVG